MTREQRKRARRRDMLLLALCVVIAVGVSCWANYIMPVPVGVLP